MYIINCNTEIGEVMTLRFILLLFTITISLNSSANPAPFGFELNRSTISDVEKKYSITVKEKNYWEGNNYYINIKSVKLAGLRELLVICNDSDVIQAVIITIDKDKFTEFFGLLSEKYQLLEKSTPSLGYRKAKFTADQSIIIMDSPYFSFYMSIIYITNDFYAQFQNKQREEKESKMKKGKPML